MTLALASAALIAWLVLVLLHGGFWLARETDLAPVPACTSWPAVTVIVPARDEAEVIGPAIRSLLEQDYPGSFGVILVDDGSSDGTARLAREVADRSGAYRLQIIGGSPPPGGWTGKLWALSNGAAAAGATPDWLWFSDADIVHAPDTLRSLVARAEADGVVLHSLMAELRCDSWAERALIPAFVFFFAMLYPFGRVNRPGHRMAAAAGGCMLVRRTALEQAGGLAAVRGAIIDDCALGRALKKVGPIRLSLTHRARSIRPYRNARAIGAMIARSAYAQLRYSPGLLAGTVAGMTLLYIVPVAVALFGRGVSRWEGVAAWLLMALAFQPMLAFYRRSPFWGAALPGIAAFYTGATVASALAHWQGRGGLWKGRVQAQLQP